MMDYIGERLAIILNSTFDEAQIRARFPDVLDAITRRVSLADLMTGAGMTLRPISPDSTGVLVAECPNCAGPMMAHGGQDGQ